MDSFFGSNALITRTKQINTTISFYVDGRGCGEFNCVFFGEFDGEANFCTLFGRHLESDSSTEDYSTIRCRDCIKTFGV